jgi:hypothetical protein
MGLAVLWVSGAPADVSATWKRLVVHRFIHRTRFIWWGTPDLRRLAMRCRERPAGRASPKRWRSQMQILSMVRSKITRRFQMGRDRGMSTAEYAVGTVAAAGFAGLLFKLVTSPEVRQLLLGIIKKALQLAG